MSWQQLISEDDPRPNSLWDRFKTFSARFKIKNIPSEVSDTGLNFTFAKQLFQLCRIVFSEKITWLWFALMIVLIIISSTTVSFTGNVTGGFTQSLVDRDKGSFAIVVITAIPVVLGAGLLRAFLQFSQDLLSRQWRKTLVHHLHFRYYKDNLFYRLEVLFPGIDNPDQRITQDVDKFSGLLSDVLMELLNSPLNLCLYTYKTWIYIGWYAPVVLFIYFILGYTLTKLIMDPISKLTYLQEISEGDFRFDHMRARTFAESIAIYNAGKTEQHIAERSFGTLLATRLRVIKWRLGLNSAVNAFSYWGSIINYFIVAIPILYIPDEQVLNSPYFIGQASFNCMMLMWSFGTLIGLSPKLSELVGLTSRIKHLLNVMNDILEEEEDNSPRPSLHGNILFNVENVNLCTPKQRYLVKHLTMQVVMGRNLYISGPSGSGKTSLLRCLMNIWPYYNGLIEYNPDKKIGYIPQKPYLFKSSVRDLITYPMVHCVDGFYANDQEIETLLRKVGLRILDENNIDDIIDYYNILSPGEQQCIAFARLLYQKPDYAILDESTSAVSEDTENKLYDLCINNNITIISISHRSSVKKYHHQEMRFDGELGYSISSIEDHIL